MGQRRVDLNAPTIACAPVGTAELSALEADEGDPAARKSADGLLPNRRMPATVGWPSERSHPISIRKSSMGRVSWRPWRSSQIWTNSRRTSSSRSARFILLPVPPRSRRPSGWSSSSATARRKGAVEVASSHQHAAIIKHVNHGAALDATDEDEGSARLHCSHSTRMGGRHFSSAC